MPTTLGSRFSRRVLWGGLMTDTCINFVNGCEILASVDTGDELGRYVMLHNPRNRRASYIIAWLRYDEPNQWYWGDYLETIDEAKQSLFDKALAAL